MLKKSALITAGSLLLMAFTGLVQAAPTTKGIYINQGTLEDTKRLNYLIEQSKAVGINTFVVDMEKPTRNYQKNIDLIKNSGIKYVARVVVFPDGGNPKQLKSQEYWEKRLKLVDTAIDYGADEIQLDYIRYSTKQPPSEQNAKDVKQVIKFFKEKVAAKGKPLQIDIFGEVSFKESPRIGQNIQTFADTIDTVCPMVYPSHYHPYQKHSAEPYNTVYKSLTSLKGKFENEKMPFKLTPYIEASNYHYKWSNTKKTAYINSQIKAVEDAKADGWFVWSPQNHYDNLFLALKTRGANPTANFESDYKEVAKAETDSAAPAKAAEKTAQKSSKSAKAQRNAKAFKAERGSRKAKMEKGARTAKANSIKATAKADSNTKIEIQ